MTINKDPNVLMQPVVNTLNPSNPDDVKQIQDCIRVMCEYTQTGMLGLAAPQIGIFLPIVYVKNAFYINPTYTPMADTHTVVTHEGCSSLPDTYCSIPRFYEIQITAKQYMNVQDLDMPPLFDFINKQIKGPDSFLWQHETDHTVNKSILHRALPVRSRNPHDSRIWFVPRLNDFYVEGSDMTVFSKKPVDVNDLTPTNIKGLKINGSISKKNKNRKVRHGGRN